MLKGYKCKGGSKSRRCRCKEDQRACGPGCQCINCGNLHIFIPKVHDTTAVLDADGEDDESSDGDFEDLYGEDNGEDDTNYDNLAGGVVQDTEMEKIMEFVFG